MGHYPLGFSQLAPVTGGAHCTWQALREGLREEEMQVVGRTTVVSRVLSLRSLWTSSWSCLVGILALDVTTGSVTDRDGDWDITIG